MNDDYSLPLSEPQARHLSITLAGLEWDLHRLRQTLAQPPCDLFLNHFEDPIVPEALAPIENLIGEAEAQLHKMAQDLGLAPAVEPVRRTFLARLELAGVELYESRPSTGLRGYGEVRMATAKYLDDALPPLENQLRKIIRFLEWDTSNPTRGS